MANFIWSKTNTAKPGDLVQAFLSGQDILLDQHLFLYDITATKAHVKGLQRIGILDEKEQRQLTTGLKKLAKDFQAGTFRLEPPLEDGHSAIEFWLTENLGPVGGKIHTGRSRNDQVQVALRLYMRDKLDQLANRCLTLAGNFLARAWEMQDWPMPGYTHLQRAVPSSVGLWAAGYAESFTDIAALAHLTKNWINTNPLGTAAGFGVNLPLDREGVSKELGFARQQINPLYVQNSRGRFEIQTLTVVAQATLELRRFAWDLSLFSTREFGFVQIPAHYQTGSSIMPNKTNPDAVELLRAHHSVVEGALSELQSLLSLPSGYHRDLQLTKPPLIRATEGSDLALQVAAGLVAEVKFDKKAMKEAIETDMFSTDVAIEKAAQGKAFREAYKTTPGDEALKGRTPEASLTARVSPGGCANLGLGEIDKRLEDLRKKTKP